MKVRFALVMALCVMGLTVMAAADSTKVTFTNSYSPLGGPAPNGVYYYPYVITVNGSKMNVACDDYNDDIYITNPGEYWTATVNTFNASGQISGGIFAPGGVHYSGLSATQQTNYNQLYQEAAWLFSQFQNPANSSEFGAINFALWDLFINPSHTLPSDGDSAAWLHKAQSADFTNFDFSRFVIYTPVPNTEHPFESHQPQELIGEVPEPGTWLLMLSGVLGLAGLAWWQKQQKIGVMQA